MVIIQPVLGLIFLFALAWLVSEARERWSWRLAGAGLVVQLGLAGLALHAPAVREAVQGLNGVILALDAATKAGTSLVFGYLGGGVPYHSRKATPGRPSCWPSRRCPWSW
jgi:CNT family concentrative nucleoside transporter